MTQALLARTGDHLVRAAGDGTVPVLHPVAADGIFQLLWLVVALPLAGAALLLVVPPLLRGGAARLVERHGHWVGVVASGASFLLSTALFVALLRRGEEERQVSQHLWTWFRTGAWDVGFDLLLDPLSVLFLLLITGVGTLIHVYSVAYMEHDERRRRFFGYLNLFVAAMLLLVLGGNFLVLFLGWEGVGLASYLLIGFWQHKPSASSAAQKAFVMNRVGDVGLALGVGLLFATFGTTDFAAVSAAAERVGESTMTALGLLLLLAACGKSAQVPLQGWLLDAMEGPTPVSALIHAATMVTAGVYLVVRSNFVFEYAPVAQTAVVVVAVVTLLYGAVIGCAKDDVKKVLAASTMSQIGYMMLAAGLGVAGYAFAILHLLTHGFFKATMFLGAGSVMHGMDDEVDMRRYGRLAHVMPITYATFAMGYLAIIGFPGFSGFWSKDKVIESALADNTLVGLLALLGAGITGFYMTRLFLMTFWTDQRWRAGVHPHESPKLMTVPLVLLAGASVLGGVLLVGDWIVDFLTPVVGTTEHLEPPIPALAITALVTLTVVIGVLLAWVAVGRRDVPVVAPRGTLLTRAVRADLYADAATETLVVEPTRRLAGNAVVFDRHVVDGAVEGGAEITGLLSTVLRKAQNGYVRSYALSMVGGAVSVVLLLWVVNLG